jgi:hypothetical protein
VKTLDTFKFWGTQTIAEVPIVDPGALYEVNLFVHSSIWEFSHSLGRLRKFSDFVSGRSRRFG